MPLAQSLQSYGTGWCTAGESTAEAQLKGGDFYVYYSYDEQGKPIIPRVAIRMQGPSITEVRGIAHEQNLDPYIGKVVDEKLAKFPDGKIYQKKSADMKRLTEIDKKNTKGEELTTDDLRFLYQLDSKIEGFGYQADPRIQEILANRDIKSELSLQAGYSKEQISTTKDEALKGGIKYHYGELDLGSLKSAEGLKLPETVGGSLDLEKLESAEGLELPKTVSGYLKLTNLRSTKGLKLPETVGGGLDLNSLRSAKGLKLPETLGAVLFLSNLRSAEGLELPKTVGGSLYLNDLQSTEGLKLPEIVGGDLVLSSLQSVEGLKLPEKVGGNLYLSNLRSAEGLELLELERVGGSLHFGSLQSTEKERLKKAYPKLRIV